VILIYHSDYIAYSGYFRLSAYTWGIFLAYIIVDSVATLFPRILGSGT